jgi:hypothetical protein
MEPWAGRQERMRWRPGVIFADIGHHAEIARIERKSRPQNAATRSFNHRGIDTGIVQYLPCAPIWLAFCLR